VYLHSDYVTWKMHSENVLLTTDMQ
jgi:hypothetical protein